MLDIQLLRKDAARLAERLAARGFDFTVRDHVDIGEGLNQLDFAAAVKITGSRFAVMRGAMAKLHRALAQFMLDVHTTEHGYTAVYVSYLVNADSMRGTGHPLTVRGTGPRGAAVR